MLLLNRKTSNNMNNGNSESNNKLRSWGYKQLAFIDSES